MIAWVHASSPSFCGLGSPRCRRGCFHTSVACLFIGEPAAVGMGRFPLSLPSTLLPLPPSPSHTRRAVCLECGFHPSFGVACLLVHSLPYRRSGAYGVAVWLYISSPSSPAPCARGFASRCLNVFVFCLVKHVCCGTESVVVLHTRSLQVAMVVRVGFLDEPLRQQRSHARRTEGDAGLSCVTRTRLTSRTIPMDGYAGMSTNNTGKKRCGVV